MTSVEVPPRRSGADEIEGHTHGIVSTSALLVVRRLLVTAGSAVATVVIARQLSTESFGLYSAALATFFLAQAFCDLGFAAVVARELAVRPGERSALLRAGLRSALAWSVVVAVVLAVLALMSSDAVRTMCLAILVPAVAVTGLSVTRQWFIATYDARRMAGVDTMSNGAQVVALIVVALLGGGPESLTVIVAVGTIANTVVVAVAAVRRAGPASVRLADSRAILWMALPIGVPSLLASAYFSIDVVLAGYLVPAAEVAQYAAAVKLLTLVTVLPALLLSVALPGVSAVRASSDRHGLGELVSRVWHLLVATAIPVCIVLALYAPLVVRTLFGSRFVDAADPLRVLMAAGAIAMVSNVLGILLIAARRSAATLVPNVIAVAANVALNVVLLPRFGIMSAAWITLATEAFVVGYSLVLLRRIVDWRPCLRVSCRPLVAAACAAGPGLVPIGPAPLQLLLSVTVFVGVLTLVRGWPVDLWPGRLHRRMVDGEEHR